MHKGLSIKTVWIITIFIFVLLMISLVPVMTAGRYAHPHSDDFGYSTMTRQAVLDGKGIDGILSAAAQTSETFYNVWQGTYAASFIFSLQPAILSEKIYFLTTVVLVFSLVGSTVIFIQTLFRALNYARVYGYLLSFFILLLSIHFTPDKHEAFFWWNGSIYYTFFYSLSLLLYSLWIKLGTDKKAGHRIICFIPAILLSAVVAGGNYSTALVSMVLLTLILFAAWKLNRKALPLYAVLWIVMLLGLVISMTAPGNRVRASQSTGMSPFRAVLQSIYWAVLCSAQWTGLAQIAFFLVTALIALHLTKKTRFSFRWPLLSGIVSFLVFASQFTPPLYAISSIGSGRQIDIYHDSYYMFAAFNIFYLAGWVNRKKLIHIDTLRIRQSHFICGWILIIFMVLCGCLNYGLEKITFFDTLYALQNNEPQRYHAEYTEIVNELNQGHTAVPDIDTVPDFFSPFCISEDPQFWVNLQMADYFNLPQVIRSSD